MNEILVIGAGRRARNAILPALWCLRPRWKITAVCTRSRRPLTVGPFSTETKRLEDVDLRSVAFAIAAVRPEQMPVLLQQLTERSPEHLVLMLDTPVLKPAQIGAARHLRAFKRVLVAEDTIALPPFRVIKRLLAEGAIGALQHIYMFHSGYKYHAYASLKVLAGSPIRTIRGRRFGRIQQKTLTHENGVTSVMYEPRDYATGRLLLLGERGAIADYDLNHEADTLFRIGYRCDGPIFRGLTMNGDPVAPDELDDAYLTSIWPDVEDGSPMNTMKIRGLMSLIDAASLPSSPYHYDVASGLADSMSARLLERVGYMRPDLLEHAMRLITRPRP